MTRAGHRTILALVGTTILAGACDPSPSGTAPAWRPDCPPIVRPAPLSLDAARDAHRLAERRRAVRFREAAEPGTFLRTMHATLDPAEIAAGNICLGELADLGEMLFEHEYGLADGLGGGDRAPARPFRRVHRGLAGGPETLSCPSCHWIGGPNGAGAETDNALLFGDGAATSSADARNPPALLGLGVVQALAAEMTRELQRQRATLLDAVSHGRGDRTVRLTAKGIDFGVLGVAADGTIDTSGLDGIDADLVVKPFGWKGTLATFAEFAAEALHVHMGVQSDALVRVASAEVVGQGPDPDDPDADGIRHELGDGPFVALGAHLSLLELPIVDPLLQHRQLAAPAEAILPPTTTSFAEDFRRGRDQFHALGCAGCHVPMLVLDDPHVVVDGMPPIDLSRDMRQPALRFDPAAGGYPVWLFSDLKRHDMGEANAARHVERGVPPRTYVTPRLWGVADSAPYLHDGRAPSFDYAIAGHDGDGAAARAAFEALPPQDRGPLRVYLMSLRRAPRVVVP